jgi:hypothetical protein
MKEIKLNCFAGNETCQVISDLKNFSILSPLENEYSLQITNQSENDCEVNLQLKRIEQSDTLSEVKLLITREKELLFQDSLEIFFKQKTTLGSIKSKTSSKYFLTFDFINLSVENKKITLNFDFSLNFHCADRVIEDLTVAGPASSQVKATAKENKSEVLSAADDNNPKIAQNSNFLSSPIFYLLSSLFIVVFFVIIKFVNGKKKKNKE